MPKSGGGSRETGYGGYRYDGRWRKVADAMVAAYAIKPGMRVLDVGSGKGFLLHDFREAVPGVEVAGIDISNYGVANTMEDIKSFCRVGSATKLPWPDKHFDLVISITTLHNLYNYELDASLREIERVGRGRQISLRRGLSQRAGEGESDVLATHLPRLPHASRMGVRVWALRLYRRPRVHLFRMSAPRFRLHRDLGPAAAATPSRSIRLLSGVARIARIASTAYTMTSAPI